MEAARIQIELKVAGAYSDQAYMFDFDYLIMAIKTQCKSFTVEVGSLKTKWQLGTDATLTPKHIHNMIEQMYNNYMQMKPGSVN